MEPTVRTVNVTNQRRPGPNAVYGKFKGSWDWFNKLDLQKWRLWKDQQQ